MTGRRKGLPAPFRKRPGQKGAGSYAVGYGKPPAHTRFRKGQSGNPSGRPKGRATGGSQALQHKRLKEIILDEAYRDITVQDGGRPVTVPMVQAVVRSLAVSAAKGNARAQKLLAEMLLFIEGEKRRTHEEWVKAAVEYKSDWEMELERRERLGIEGPEPIPHPDHIHVDFQTSEVVVRGPMTKQEKVVWDRMKARKEDCPEEIAWLRRALKKKPDDEHLRKSLEQETRLYERLCQLFPD